MLPKIHVILLGLMVIALAREVQADDLFADRVAPLLERRCLNCHNDTQREGGWSLQTASSAFEDGYIQAGNAASSHLIDQIATINGKAEMPKDGTPLTDEEVDWVREWINAGAKWPENRKLEAARVRNFDWWSFRNPTLPSVPSIQDPWIRTPVDAFILHRLKEQGLTHSPDADRRTLIRRVTFDLLGLPPTPEETESFVNDPDPLAYERLVERLLESKHYGERWARHWLDIVKYADTCGYDKDKLRNNAWPYRDYVIRSFNDDKPYSRFVQEQIAGDALFPGDPDGILGLGFIAAGPWDFIGHVEVPETKIDGKVARNLDRDDMVSNTINTFCSLTIQCARCHNHKFDPFTQEHYYGLQSVFAAVDRAERPYDLNPEIERQRKELDAILAKTRSDLAMLEKEIETDAGPQYKEYREQIASIRSKQVVTKDVEFGYHSAISASAGDAKWVEVQLVMPARVTTVVLHPCHDEFAGIGSGFGFPRRFKVEGATKSTNSGEDFTWTILADYSQSDFSNPGLNPVEIACDGRVLERIRVTATSLAPRQSDFIFALAEMEILGESNGENKLINHALQGNVYALDSIEGPPRWGQKNLIDGKWAKGGDRSLDQQLTEVTEKFDAIRAMVETPARIQQRTDLQSTIEATDKSLQSLPPGAMVYAAATHFVQQGNFKPTQGKPRPIHILIRGEVEKPGEPALPGLLPLDETTSWRLESQLSESQCRAQLARWLTQREHPLVWRSIVNRIWQYHFGQGIVSTPNDFGRMGALPTHPELLDWLACQFRDGGESMQRESFKSLHRLLVTSSVYRQSSANNDAMAQIDGGNQYLWRMNRRRLEAEEIRDSILSASGALNPAMGGPGYYLFELEHPEHSPHYEYRKFDPSNPTSHRRSIYSFIVRSQPDPWMTTLDCADSSQSTPRRNETLTSLQALSLLNNRFSLVMAERFANRIESEASSRDEQVVRAMQLIAQRDPTPEEAEEFSRFTHQYGLKNLCRFLFNLSEFAFVD